MINADGPVLLTGASGTIGSLLAHRLAALGWTLRLTDVSALPYELPQGASFEQFDLEDRKAVERLARDCPLILHFGGVSTEQSFEAILGPNYRGAYHIYEAALKNGARVVFPSSVHAVGLYERTARLDADCLLRPDGYYGLSKVYGEMLARLYWDKHEIESVIIRIGSVLPDVSDERILSTWVSHDDFVRLITAARSADFVGCIVVWGASANSRSFWLWDQREVLGWAPLDSSDKQAAKVKGKVTTNSIVERYQGGKFVIEGYTRKGLVEPEMFSRD